MLKRLSKMLSLFGPFLGLLFVYVLFLIITWAMSNPEDRVTLFERFRSAGNTKTILTQAVIVGIGALGMTFIIVSGGIDLSVGSMVALGTVVTAMMLKNGIPENAAGAGVWLPLVAALAGVAACALCGLVNGLIISLGRIVPFIVTLGTMQIVRGLAKGIAGSTTVEVRQIGSENIWINHMMMLPRSDALYAVAPGVWLMIGLLIATFVVLRYTVFGRHVVAIGSNEATARLCGVNVTMQRIWIYTIGGALTGVAAVMQFSRLTLGSPTEGIGLELDIIAAVVIGGGSLSGGEGSAIGSVVGALIIVTLRNGCSMAGAENFVQNIIIGVIIIVAVAVDRLKRQMES